MEAIKLKMIRRNLFNIPASEKVCRSLFGEVDHDVIKQDLKKELMGDMKQRSKVWNFDFENYVPTENVDGLKWTSCSSGIAEYKTKPGTSLVTSFSTGDSVSKNSEQSLTSPPNRDSIVVSQELKTRLEPSTNEQLFTSNDDDDNVTKIVNTSPTRPRILRSELNTNETIPLYDQTSPLRGKRKRGSQQKIDDFMKKKKPRVCMDLSLRKDAPLPVAARLRSSPCQVSV